MSIGRTISIVDDDEAVRLAVASLVRSIGWQARVFASAEEFLACADLADTICVISDERMSGMSGAAMNDRLVQLGYTIPTIFVTAFPTPGLCAKVGANGVLAVVEKPLDAQAMEHWLKVALSLM
ncbi:response regulator transcription factor [Trinickia soli]|uniref:Response regulator n=1 Tax=Trinickia soli TaxID=380675 RepID=A0A2N7VV85_9BURK|nr:response regulator [Trinickia soli]KAA0089782.1 response regulator [Paraburkholderia sp. T12-10]PMS21070.1 response regulator [Trinickia soli]CAB3666264.1 Response regulator protein TmoT [Trinickia soli]